MATPPIYNPVVPCVHQVPMGLFPGRMIRIQGNVPPGAQRFAINLQCGPNTDPRDDIALHLNFRFVEMCVVRNHLTAMNWGVEETQGGMPLVRGEAFEALLLCDPQSIKVALNGAHFCEFPHRVPFQRISHITVDGDVHIQFMGFEGAQAPPQQQMYMSEPPSYAYGAPPPAYGAPGYGAPQGFGGQQPPSTEPIEDKTSDPGSDPDQSKPPSKTRIVQNPETNGEQSQKIESNQPENSKKCDANQELSQICDSDLEDSVLDDYQAKSSEEKYIWNVLSKSKSKQSGKTTDVEIPTELKEDRSERSDRETTLKLLDSVFPISNVSPKKSLSQNKLDTDLPIETSPHSSELECVLEPPSNSQTPGRNSKDSSYSVICTKQTPQSDVKNVDYKLIRPESQLRLPLGPKKVEFVKIHNNIDGPLFEQNFPINEDFKPQPQSSSKVLKQEQNDVSDFSESTSVSSKVQVIKSSSHSEHIESPIQSNLLVNQTSSKTQGMITFATGNVYFEELQSSYESWGDEKSYPEFTDKGQIDKPASKLNIETVYTKTGQTNDSPVLDFSPEIKQSKPNDATNSGSNEMVTDSGGQPIDDVQNEASPIMCDEVTQTDPYSSHEPTRRIMPIFFGQEEGTRQIAISHTFGKLSPFVCTPPHRQKECIHASNSHDDQAEYSRREDINPNIEIPIINADFDQSSILCPYGVETPQPQKSLIEIQPTKISSATQKHDQLESILPIEPDTSWKQTVEDISESHLNRERSTQNTSEPKKPDLPKTDEGSCCLIFLMGCYTCLFCDKCFGPWGGDSDSRTFALDFATPSRVNVRKLSTVSGASEKTTLMSSTESLPK